MAGTRLVFLFLKILPVGRLYALGFGCYLSGKTTTSRNAQGSCTSSFAWYKGRSIKPGGWVWEIGKPE